MARSRVLAVILLGASLCFSRLSTPAPPTESETSEGIAESKASAAWLRAARRTAEGKRDSGAHWAAAWEATEAWWLRPVALLVTYLFTCVAVMQQLPSNYLRAVMPKRKEVKEVKDQAVAPLERLWTPEMTQEMQCLKCLRALQRMELPVFGTSARWSSKDQGVLVSVNLRGSVEDWSKTAELLKPLIQEALLEAKVDLSDRDVVLHLLQAEDGYELLVRWPKRMAGGMGSPLISLGLVLACSQWTSPLQGYDDLGALGACLGLLLLAEVVREGLARAQDVELGARTFLPCPQLGLLGIFSAATASPSKSHQLILAICPSLVLLFCGGLLGFQDWFPEWTVQLHSNGLPLLSRFAGECSVTSLVAGQAILMASLALLPQSPQGRAAWAVLIGREKSDQLADVMSYVYPFMGVFILWVYGLGTTPAVLSLPFTWQLLLTNLVPAEQPPALEESSEPPMPLKLLGLGVLLGAMALTSPMP